MQNKSFNIELNMYAKGISDILKLRRSMRIAAKKYKLDLIYLSMFMHTIQTKGKIIKGENKEFSFYDELAFLLYIKICPQGHCVCLACFEEHLSHLIYKFVKYNNLNYPGSWDMYQEADELTKMEFLRTYRNVILRLFSKDCLKLSPNNYNEE